VTKWGEQLKVGREGDTMTERREERIYKTKRDKNYDLGGENKGRIWRGGGGHGRVRGGWERDSIFFKLNSTYCYFAWVVVVACLALSLSLSLSLSADYTDVPRADSCGASYSSNVHTTRRRANVWQHSSRKARQGGGTLRVLL
jgi:hypothetical protein